LVLQISPELASSRHQLKCRRSYQRQQCHDADIAGFSEVDESFEVAVIHDFTFIDTAARNREVGNDLKRMDRIVKTSDLPEQVRLRGGQKRLSGRMRSTGNRPPPAAGVQPKEREQTSDEHKYPACRPGREMEVHVWI
jgi:hypothetical protein